MSDFFDQLSVCCRLRHGQSLRGHLVGQRLMLPAQLLLGPGEALLYLALVMRCSSALVMHCSFSALVMHSAFSALVMRCLKATSRPW